MRESEKQTDRQTDRQTQMDTPRQKYGDRQGRTDQDKQTETDRQTDRQIDGRTSRRDIHDVIVERRISFQLQNILINSSMKEYSRSYEDETCLVLFWYARQCCMHELW